MAILNVNPTRMELSRLKTADDGNPWSQIIERQAR